MKGISMDIIAQTDVVVTNISPSLLPPTTTGGQIVLSSYGETKTCKRCEKEKEIANSFYTSRRDGGKVYIDTTCKQCRSEERKSGKGRKQQEHNNEELPFKKCLGCEQEKSLEHFSMRKAGYQYYKRLDRCKECERFAYNQREKIRREKKEQERLEEERALMAMPYAERVQYIERKN